MPRMDQYDIKAAPTTSDQLLIIDVADGSQSPEGTTKRAVIGTLPGGGGGGGIQPPAGDIGGTAQAPTVVATHVPALSPVGLTGATAASRYVGATVSGAPASGAFLLGDFAVDQTGKIWICTTAGSPGTWTAAGPTIPVTIAQGGTGQTTQQAAIDALTGTQSAGKYLRSDGTHATLQAIQAADVPVSYQPWQFRPETYGAKGDAKMLYDVHMDGTTAVLTTAGLPAPSSWMTGSQIAGSGTGGTITAGVVQVQTTYVNEFGETLPSTAASYTASGTTSSVAANSPLPWTNATGYNVYATAPGGATFFKQNTTPIALRTSYTITANPSSGAAPPGVNTSNSAPFTSADVGKAIAVPSAGGFLNVPLVTTIQSYQSATQVTLAAVSSSAVTGMGAVYATDDTTAVQSCINAAVAYAQAQGTEEANVDVILNNVYGIAGALTGTYQNAQLVIPFVDPYSGPKVNLRFVMPQEAPGPVHWEQPNPPMPRGTLVSIYYNDSGSPPSPNPTVMAGPATGAFGGNGGLFSNMRVSGDLNFLVAYRPSIIGLDLYGCAQAAMNSIGYFCLARTSTAAGGWPPYLGGASNPYPWGTFAYRTPTTGNNAQNEARKITVYGPKWGVMFTDHFHCDVMRGIYVYETAGIAATASPHACYIGTLISEQAYAPLFTWQYVDQQVFIASMQVENATVLIDDTPNHIYGEVHAELEGLTGYIAANNGAANVKLVYELNPAGPVASPQAPPATGVAWQNRYYKDAEITLSVSGGTMTALSIDGVDQYIPANCVLWKFTLPSGHSYTPTYTGTLAHNVTLL